jgi:hypothetical protein
MNTKSLFFALVTIMVASCTNAPETKEYAATAKLPHSKEGNIIPNQYIIELEPSFIAPATARLDRTKQYTREEKGRIMEGLNAEITKELELWLTKNGITSREILYTYTAAIVGVAIHVSEDKFEKLSVLPEVKGIEHDRVEYIPNHKVESIDNADVGSRAQTTPCGITNAGGATTGNASRWLWIVDSGIDLDHPDLQVVTNTTYAKTFVSGTTTADDCNGHGTHVAGTAAARNNTIGVIGVAAGANVVPVRVFNCTGGSATSTIVAGINHVATYDVAGDVCNMSLGGFYGAGCSTGSSYLSAINALASGGTRCAIASGNNLSNAANYQPACINGTNIFTVTNMRCNKTYYNDPTYGGNFGAPPVDWIATGTSVYSTYLNGGYATLTGTSMATPTVAGIMQVRNAAPLQNGTVAYGGVNYKIAVR